VFDSFFEFNCVGYTKSANREHLLGIWHYSFKSPKHRYLVEIEHYIKNIYVIQYFPIIHKNNPRKYMLLTNEHQCRPIVGTCIRILLDILSKNELATFGFIGSNTYNPETGQEESMNETQRWKVYRHAMESRIGVETFSHAWLPMLSRYVMVNKKSDVNDTLNEINRIFSKMYDKEI